MNIIHAIGADPRAWIVLGLFAARAIWSAAMLARHRLAAENTDVADMAPALTRRMLSWRFVPIMLLGIALAVIGLFRLSHSAAQPAFTLFLLLLGVYLFTTEPVRRQISLAEKRVRDAPSEAAKESAIADLRESHVKLVAFEVTIVAVLLIGMLAL